MRGPRFITEHRGGPLRKEQHIQMMKWACACSKNILQLSGDRIDDRLNNALAIRQGLIG